MDADSDAGVFLPLTHPTTRLGIKAGSLARRVARAAHSAGAGARPGAQACAGADAGADAGAHVDDGTGKRSSAGADAHARAGPARVKAPGPAHSDESPTQEIVPDAGSLPLGDDADEATRRSRTSGSRAGSQLGDSSCHSQAWGAAMGTSPSGRPLRASAVGSGSLSPPQPRSASGPLAVLSSASSLQARAAASSACMQPMESVRRPENIGDDSGCNDSGTGYSSDIADGEGMANAPTLASLSRSGDESGASSPALRMQCASRAYCRAALRAQLCDDAIEELARNAQLAQQAQDSGQVAIERQESQSLGFAHVYEDDADEWLRGDEGAGYHRAVLIGDDVCGRVLGAAAIEQGAPALEPRAYAPQAAGPDSQGIDLDAGGPIFAVNSEYRGNARDRVALGFEDPATRWQDARVNEGRWPPAEPLKPKPSVDFDSFADDSVDIDLGRMMRQAAPAIFPTRLQAQPRPHERLADAQFEQVQAKQQALLQAQRHAFTTSLEQHVKPEPSPPPQLPMPPPLLPLLPPRNQPQAQIRWDIHSTEREWGGESQSQSQPHLQPRTQQQTGLAPPFSSSPPSSSSSSSSDHSLAVAPINPVPVPAIQEHAASDAAPVDADEPMFAADAASSGLPAEDVGGASRRAAWLTTAVATTNRRPLPPMPVAAPPRPEALRTQATLRRFWR